MSEGILLLLLLGPWTPLLVCIPLAVYCARQQRAGRLLLSAVVGALVGAGAGLGLVIRSFHGQDASGAPGVGYLALMMLCGSGWVIGAHSGVALAEALSADPDRRVGARRGALWGLGAGLVVAVALCLVGGTPWINPIVLGVVVPLGITVGALFGAQAGIARRFEPAEQVRLHWRRFSWLGVVLVLVLGIPGWLRYDYERQHRLQGERRARRQKYKPFEHNEGPLGQLRSKDPRARPAAAQELGNAFASNQGDDRIVPALVRATGDPNRSVRLAAVEALGSTRDPSAIEPLGKLLEDDDPDIRLAALIALVGTPDYRISPYVRKAAQDSDPRVARLAAQIIRQARGPRRPP